MTHPLQAIMAETTPIVVIGDSSKDRFPAFSYAAYTHAKKPFYVLDLGGLTESRGPVKGGKVYTSVSDLPADRGDLAVVWVHPHDCARAVEVAHEAGCKRVWFSFQTGHEQGVARARELGMQVVEIGRCPVYYLSDVPVACKGHTLVTKVSGTWAKPPQTEAGAKRRELV